MTVATNGHRPAEPVARVEPHNLDAEQALLGSMLYNRAAIPAALEHVRTEDFYRLIHGHIFDAITSIHAAGDPVDPLTVAAVLDKAEQLEQAGGVAALDSLIVNVPSSTSAGHYARMVRRAAAFRRLVAVGGDISELGYRADGEADDAIDRAETLLHALTDERRSWREVQRLGETAGDWIERIEARCARTTPEGVATGWTELDGYLAGIRPGQLITVAARPGAGKSAFAGALAIHAAQDGYPVLFVSVEMSRAELEDRFLASITDVGLDPIRHGKVTPKDWQRIYARFPPVLDLPIYIEDDPAMTITGVRSAARRVAHRAGRLGLVIVDYIQLITATGRAENRQVEVAEISRGLKKLALELDVPVVSLAQLNRQLELRGTKKPMLSDLRESGAIENDSDVVLFLFRPEMYDGCADIDRGVCDVIVAKQRNGPIGEVRLAYDTRFGKFTDLVSKF